MNKRISTLFILTIILWITNPHPAHAKSYGDHPWSFGGYSGVALGFQGLNYTSCSSSTGMSGIGCSFSNLFETLYGTIPVMAVADYRFTKHFSLRGALGVDIYDRAGIYFDSMPRVFPAAEILAVWHIREKASLFHPYLAGGLRFPVANPEAVVGNQFNISKRFSLFMEAALNTIGVDTKIEGRLGFMLHY
jgi:hypothetical protein